MHPREVKCVCPPGCPFCNSSRIEDLLQIWYTCRLLYNSLPLICFFFLKSTSLHFWHSLSIYNFALAICPYVGEVQVDSRSECLLETHFNFVCLYVCKCSFIYVPRFNAIADFWFLYLAKFWDILRPGFRSYGCCSDTIAFQNDNVWCNWWR